MNESSTCRSELISGWLQGQLADGEEKTLERHLEECVACRQQLACESGEHHFGDQAASLNDDQWDRDWQSSQIDPRGLPVLHGKDSNRQKKLQAVFETVKPLLHPSDDPESVGRIGGYEVLGLIGSGGMGVVLKAKDTRLNRVVAIKVLAPHLAVFESARARFQNEAKSAAAVKHNGIIPIYGVDCQGETPYLVMPYEVGPSLQQRIAATGPLSIEDTLSVTTQIADALSAAHQLGLVHRDIKPSNILLAPGTARALLTDFGLAQIENGETFTQTGLLAGTPMFMSPEQARGETVDARSDLFSLGSVLYSMVVGEPPLLGESTYVVVRRIGDQPMPTLSESALLNEVPQWLENLLARLHANDPGDRFQTATEVAQVANECLAHLRDPESNKIPEVLSGKSSSRDEVRGRRASMLVALAAVLLLIASVVYALVPKKQALEHVGTFGSPQTGGAPESSKGEAISPDAQALMGSSKNTEDENSDGITLEWDDGLTETFQDIERRLTTLDEQDAFLNSNAKGNDGQK